MILKWATSITLAIGRGGPWKSRLFWVQLALALLVAISGPKKVLISGTTPSNCPRNGCSLHQNHLSYSLQTFLKETLLPPSPSTVRPSLSVANWPNIRSQQQGLLKMWVAGEIFGRLYQNFFNKGGKGTDFLKDKVTYTITIFLPNTFFWNSHFYKLF